MGLHGINRVIHQIAFSDCRNGLGIQIIGGYQEQSEEDYGIFIKKILPGGIAAADSRLLIGDLILEVNGENLVAVTNERAVDILQMASATNHISLLIARDEEARKEYQDLMERYGSHSNTSSERNFPAQELHGKSADSVSSGSSSRSESPQLMQPKDLISNHHGRPITTIKSNSAWEIAFIRHETAPSQVENVQPSTHWLTSSSSGLQQRPAENIASNALVSNVLKAEFKKREQFSANNSTADVSAGAVGPTWSDDYGWQRKKISLNPSVRLKGDKLEMALNYLGIHPTKEQQEVLRQQLPKDSEGTVSFGDFVQVARNLFCLQLDGTGGIQAFNSPEMDRLLESQFVSSDPLEGNEMEELRKEKEEALKEICTLKKELAESERMRNQLTEELQNTKQEAKASVEETRTLRSRIHLAEAAQKQAHGMEKDYEEVIHLLEVEIAELKDQLANHCGQDKDSVQGLRKRITVLDCQLRKSETAKKTFEVATEKLLQFVEVVSELLSDNSASLANLSDRKATFSSKTLLARLERNGRTDPASLATEAKELVKSIRALLEADCLPYGWEEAYTADGIKYFINHVTQTTSWIHPVTNVLSLPYSEENMDNGFREFGDLKS
uniref:Syntaxin binding protein 4 n=1 Tax=Salvator merianae TaxID=96440 RepID=A0A8D0E9M3_SALMN